MKAMLTAFAASALIAVAANVILSNAGFGSADQSISANVRLD